MHEAKNVSELMSSSKAPKGVTVQAADGRLFFLTDEEAKRTAIPANLLYLGYRAISQQQNSGEVKGVARSRIKAEDCKGVKEWLDTHGPNSDTWRDICEQYFDSCTF
jgi:hypothetical protein